MFGNDLKDDFPRVPLTTDASLFDRLCRKGADLVALHLLEDDYPFASWAPDQFSLRDTFTTFPKSGSNLIEKAKHNPEENRVYINKEGQYFDNVPEETWNFRIGGYQVLDKWLKDRKDRNLSEKDIEHYKKVVKVLHETARIMREIDEVIEAHGGWPLVGSVKEEQGTGS
jgi:predicted helicase